MPIRMRSRPTRVLCEFHFRNYGLRRSDVFPLLLARFPFLVYSTARALHN